MAEIILEQTMKVQMGSGGIALSLAWGQHEGGWLSPAPSRFSTGKVTRYPLYRRLGGSEGRPERLGKSRPRRDSIPRTVQPVTSCYTD